jgi:two-component system LytT family response regulator
MILNAVIVDDEVASQETLTNYLKKYCPVVRVAGIANSVESGLETIRKHKPDVVFLDIEMPYGNAFDLLERLEEVDFEIVFVTAFSNYAIKALNLSASYYILKPIDIDELVNAVDRIVAAKENDKASVRSKILIENIQAEKKQNQKIILPLIDGFDVVKIKDIVRCQANDNFTDFYYTENPKKQMICRTLKYFDELLSDYDFVRVHKSHLVNFHHITKYIRGKGGQVVLANGDEVAVSETRKKELLSWFRR